MTDREHCTGCGACAAACPFGAIVMRPDDEGFLQPMIQKERCTDCGLCRRTCPATAKPRPEPVRQAYLAYARQRELRRSSSSGGVFGCLAEKVMAQGGVVYGCAMNRAQDAAEHIAAETLGDLKALQGAKYVQSDVSAILPQVRAAVLSGKKVLFSGTPCQIAGLRALLGNGQYDNLLLVDVICHGAPSPLVWRAYVAQREREAGAKLCRVRFRDKATGWKRYSLTMEFSNGAVYSCPVNEDPYLRGFVLDFYSRHSCYHCNVKDGNYQSDITLGDFWGVGRLRPELEHSEGVSVAVAHTQAGVAWLAMLEDICHLEPVEFETALESNPSYFHCAGENPLRRRVLRQTAKKGTKRVLEKYGSDSLTAKCRRGIWRLLKCQSFKAKP